MLDVIALGELLIDFTHTGTDADGYPAMQAHPGGAPANFLSALSALGAKTALLGKVGCDAFGKLLTDTLKDCAIDTRGLISDPSVFTTLAFVTLDDHGDRNFSFARKPGADTCLREEEVRYDLIDEARVFHFGTLSLTDEPARSATLKAVEYAKANGKLITFDPNLRKPIWDDLTRAHEAMLWGLAQADVVKISDEEVEFLFDLSPADGARHIHEVYGVSLVFVTCGADGCTYKNAHAEGHIPALSDIEVIDTTGAGDIFGGSALWKVLETDKTPDALTDAELRGITRFACVAAGLSTTRPGGISSVPSPDEIRAYL